MKPELVKPEPKTFSVQITERMGDDPGQVEMLYCGNDYLAALNKANAARNAMQWRGKFIRFRRREDVKWSIII